MLNVSRLRSRPRLFHRLVGLSVPEFEALLEAMTQAYPHHQRTRLSQRPRRRAVGAGRGFCLSLEQRLLGCLLFYRLHVNDALLELLFEIDASNLWRERNWRMQPVLEQVLPTPMQDHLLSRVEEAAQAAKQGTSGTDGKRKRIGTLTELLESYPELRDICIDGTEQEVPKPKEAKARRQRSSGKSHCHTAKTQVTTAKRLVLHVLGGVPGSRADITRLKGSGVMRSIEAARSLVKAKVKSGRRPPWALEPHQKRRARRARLDRGYCGLESFCSKVLGDKVLGEAQNSALLVAIKGSAARKTTALGRAWNSAAG